MTDVFLTGVLLPAVCLAALGWGVPRVLAIWWPEGVAWLMGLALASSFVMCALGTGLFALLYTSQGVNLDDLYATGGLAVPLHFARLSLSSALLWAPMMVLSLMYVPRGWVKEVW